MLGKPIVLNWLLGTAAFRIFLQPVCSTQPLVVRLAQQPVQVIGRVEEINSRPLDKGMMNRAAIAAPPQTTARRGRRFKRQTLLNGHIHRLFCRFQEPNACLGVASIAARP